MTPYTLNIRTRGRLSLLLLLSVMALCFPLSGSAADDDEKSEREDFSKKKIAFSKSKRRCGKMMMASLKLRAATIGPALISLSVTPKQTFCWVLPLFEKVASGSSKR